VLCAHKIEAEPFIQRYGMVQTSNVEGMTLFEGVGVQLLLTGQGRDNVARSLSKFFLRHSPQDIDYWLNFGIAGSSEFEIGTMITVCQVHHISTNMSLAVNTAHCDTLPLCRCYTVDAIEQRYLTGGVYDMEAAAIVDALQAHNVLQQLRLLKLVSDGPGYSVENLDLHTIRLMVTENADLITRVSDQLMPSTC